jgi:hypothetical protein
MEFSRDLFKWNIRVHVVWGLKLLVYEALSY